MNDDRVVALLGEIRDTQIEESLNLQREAVSRQRTITRIAVPGLIACIVALAYLVLRYF